MKRRGLLGFTLVELMVVIGILLLLAGILFPVFSVSLNRMRQAKCMSFQRQLVQGIMLFSDDHEDALPPFGDQSYYPVVYWPEYIKPYIKDTNLTICPKESKKIVSIGVNYGDLFKYANYRNSNGVWVSNKPTYVTSVDDYSKKIVLGDATAGLHLYSPKHWPLDKDTNGNGITDTSSAVAAGGSTITNNIAVSRHGDGLNVTFLDGHSRWYPGEELLHNLNLW